MRLMLVKSHERCYEKSSLDSGALFTVKNGIYTLAFKKKMAAAKVFRRQSLVEYPCASEFFRIFYKIKPYFIVKWPTPP